MRYVDTKDQEKLESLKNKARQLIDAAWTGRENEKVLDRAQKSEKYFWGEHPIRSRSQTMGNKVYNLYAKNVENVIARVTESELKWNFNPRNEDDLVTAKALDKLIGDVIWDHIDWEELSEVCILDSYFSGSNHIKIGVDQNGWPEVEVLKARQVLPDPSARDFKSLGYICFIYTKRKETVERRYGVSLQDADFRNEREDITSAKISDYVTNDKMTIWDKLDGGVRRKNLEHNKVQPKVTLVEIWTDDLTLENIPFDIKETDAENSQLTAQDLDPTPYDHNPKHIKAHEDFLATLNPEEDGELIQRIEDHILKHKEQPQETKRRKYPHGRVITVCQDQVIRDQEFAYGDHWHNFVVKWDWLKSLSWYWGKPGTLDLFDRQDAYNHRKNSITQNINMLNNGVRKIGPGAKFSQNKPITNLIGQNVRVTSDWDYKVDFGSALPPQFFNDLIDEERGIDKQAGVSEALQGNLPAPGTANSTLENLISQNLKRYGTPIKHYLSALKKIARAIIYIVTEYQPDGLRISIDVQGQTQHISPRELKDLVSIQDIHIGVKLNSTTREEELREALELAHVGIYDAKAVRDRVDDPNKIEVEQRMNQVAQLQAALQQQGQVIEGLVKQINTINNRGQSDEGQGNVGI